MRALALTAFLVLSFSSVSFAVESSKKDCAAFAESNDRVGKDLKSSDIKKTTKSSEAIKE